MRKIINSLMAVMFLFIVTPLVLGASWSAYVFDADSGLGIDAVNVTAVRLGTGTFVNSTLTNTLGFFNISISDLTPVQLVSSKIGYLNDTSQALPPITDDRVLPFNITLTKLLPGNIIGRVTNSTGSGIENAFVAAIQGSSIIDLSLTNAIGDYAIVNLTDGTYTIKVNATGYITQNLTNVVVLPNSTINVNFSLAKEVDAPIISNVASSVTASGATITWITDEDANSTVYYGTDISTVLSSSSSTLTTSHSIELSGLSSNTLYYYNVSSCDVSGNCNTSTQYTFTTSSGSNGGNGGDGGGGSGGDYFCLSSWSCTDWSECYPNGTRTRTCTDIKNCRIPINKPDEMENCVYAPPAKPFEKIAIENISKEPEKIKEIEEKSAGIDIEEKPKITGFSILDFAKIRKLVTHPLLISLLFVITAGAVAYYYIKSSQKARNIKSGINKPKEEKKELIPKEAEQLKKKKDIFKQLKDIYK